MAHRAMGGASENRELALRRPRLLLLGSCALAALLLLARLGGMPLIQPDEGRNAEVAREMMATGAWFVPTYDGVPYLDKPAAYFRAVASSLALFGTNEAAARLPSAIAAAGVLLLLFLFCRREYGPSAAALAVAIVAATPLFVIFARMVIFDMPLAFFVLLAVLAAYRAEEPGPLTAGARRAWHALAAAAAGVATLIKGPVGFIVPACVVLVFTLTERTPGWARRLFSPLNFVVFFAVVVPWILGVQHDRPDFLRYGLVEETFRRYTTGAFHRSAPWWYYAPVVLGTLFPWSALLPEAMAAVWRGRRRLAATSGDTPVDRQARAARADRLLIVTAVVVVTFFSTSRSKLPGYVLAAVIALAVLTARLFAAAFADPRGRPARIVRRGGLVLAALSLALAAIFLRSAGDPLWLERAWRFRSAEFERFAPVFPLAAASLIAVAAAGLVAFLARRTGAALVAFLLFPVSLLTVSYPGIRDYAEASSARALAVSIDGGAQGAADPRPATVACLETFPTGLPFYLQREVVLITRDGHQLTSNYLLYMMKTGQPLPRTVVAYDRRAAWLDSQARPILMVAGGDRRGDLEALAASQGGVVTSLGSGWWGARFEAGASAAGPTAPEEKP